MEYIKKHMTTTYIAALVFICIIMFFPNMTSYPFIDTDETKFVSIAKEMLNYSDWINIKLNGENVFYLSPAFFWITNLFCVLIGKISIEAMRIPISIISLFGVIILFYGLKDILTKTYAFIIALIYSTSIGIMIFSRLATNDIMSCVIIMSAIILSCNTIFSKNQKTITLCWLGIYILSAFSFVCSGFFGVLIIAISVIATHIFSGNLKEIFRPGYFLPGMFFFLVLSAPWFAIMLYKHKMLFLKEYLSIYNFMQYISIKNIGLVFGQFFFIFSPWIFSFIWILGTNAKDIINSIISYFKNNSQNKLKEKWNKLHKIDKFSSLNTIVFFVSLIFAILYGSKFTFLTLFLVFPAACISGRYWYEYFINKKHDKSIFFATIIPNLILIVCSLLGLLGHNMLNQWIFQGFNNLIIPLIVIFCIIPIVSIFAVILKGRIIPFAANIILILSLSFVITPSIFNFISTTSGENDLITFANTAKNDNVKLAAYIPSKKYSILYYYDKPVEFHLNNDLLWLGTYLKEHPSSYVIVEIKDLWDIEDNKIKYMLLDSGKRYCLIQHLTHEEEIKTDTEEPEIIVY